MSSVIHPGAIYEPSCIDKLTDAQLDEFREAFNMFDKDGGGSIDASELRDLMISVGQNCTESELKEMVEAADADGTGDIDFLEFAVLMAHKMTDENKDDTLKKAFAVFDTSGDGFISAQEMRRIMFNLGENLQQEDVEAVIGEVDVDGDGQINYQEFAKILSSDGETVSPGTPKAKPRRKTSKELLVAVSGSRERIGFSIGGDRSRKNSKEDLIGGDRSRKNSKEDLIGGDRSRKGSQDGSPPARRQSTGASAHLAAAAAGAMSAEAEQEAMAVGEEAEGGGGSPRRRSGWGVGEAPMDAEVEAAQRADNFRLIDMVEIFEQAC